MLRIFRHYVSGLTFVLLLGDLAVILGVFYLTEISAPWPGYGPFAARLTEVVDRHLAASGRRVSRLGIDIGVVRRNRKHRRTAHLARW